MRRKAELLQKIRVHVIGFEIVEQYGSGAQQTAGASGLQRYEKQGGVEQGGLLRQGEKKGNCSVVTD